MAPGQVNLPEVSEVKNHFWALPESPDLRKTHREWVYFVQAVPPPHLIKIGKTCRLKWRLRGLQTMSPVQLRLIGAISAPRGAELLLHAMFREERKHGEWFLASEALVAFIKHLPRGSAVMMPTMRQWAESIGVDADKIHDTVLNYQNGRKNLDRELARITSLYLRHKISDDNFTRMKGVILSKFR